VSRSRVTIRQKVGFYTSQVEFLLQENMTSIV